MDRNTLFAFFLIAIVLIFTPKYMEMVAPPPQAPPLPAVENTEDAISPAPAEQNTTGRDMEPDAYSVSETPGVLWSNEEKTITIESELYTAVVSSNGGGSLLSFSFKDYSNKDGQDINLINGKNKENLSIRFKNLDGENVSRFGPWRYSNAFFGGEIYKPQTLQFSIDLFPGKTIVGK